MKKIKFQIKGMNCKSCALLIEEKLKSKPGIITAKANFDAQKAVAVYDEQKISEGEISNIIREGGDYQIKKIEEPEEESGSLQSAQPSQPANQEVMTSLKGLTSLVIISLALNLVTVITSFKSLPKENKNTGAANAQDYLAQANNPSDDINPSPLDSGNSNIQTFQIGPNDRIRGDVNAPVTLVEFSDFECPFCARIYPTFNKILSDYKGKVRLVYKYFPLDFHPNARKAAEAAECAAEQGKFWEYHDKLFVNQPTGFSVDKFKQWAGELGLNATQFNGCLDTGKYAQKVESELQEGTAKGVDGTPATFVNGKLISGAQPYDAFKKEIDSLLQ